MDRDDDASALAWCWVIEALANFNQISNGTLLDCIDAAPVKHDKFSKLTKELVSLRCLESLFTHVIDPGTSASDSRVGFHFSWSCEDVLRKTLVELKMAGAKHFKWDVYPFIKHKRAETFKCHLEQLEESILDGTHLHADYLKERSGLFPRNSSYMGHVNDGKRDDHPDKDAGNSTDAEDTGEKENSVSLFTEKGNKSSKKLLLDNGNNFSPSQWSRGISTDDHLASNHEEQVCMNECDDIFINSKRIKCYASTLGDGSLEDCQNRCTASKLYQSSGHVEVFLNESNIPLNDTSHLPQDPVCDKAIIYVANGGRAVSTSVCDGYHKEKDNLEATKHKLLCSHRTVDQGFPAMTESTDQILCMECDEGGELLACKTTTCPLMVHKSCLGASAQLDAEGSFFCPFCVYSHTISECLEAEEKAYLARKEFGTFIGKGKQN